MEADPYRSGIAGDLARLVALWDTAGFRRAIVPEESAEVGVRGVTLLWALGVHGPARAVELVALTNSTAPSVSKALGRLEQQGLVRRVESAADRRERIVTLTAAGERYAAHLYAVGDELIDRALEGWSRHDRVELEGMLRRFAADLLRESHRISDGVPTDDG